MSIELIMLEFLRRRDEESVLLALAFDVDVDVDVDLDECGVW